MLLTREDRIDVPALLARKRRARLGARGSRPRAAKPLLYPLSQGRRDRLRVAPLRGEQASLVDAVGRPALDQAREVPDAGLRFSGKRDAHLIHGRFGLTVELMALLAKHLVSLDLVEQRVREPVDLRVGGVSAGEDPEVDDDAWPLVLFLDEYECWIGHAPLIPSRGSQRNMRSARRSPAR